MAGRNKKNIVFYLSIGFLISVCLLLYGYIFGSLNKNTTHNQINSLNNAQLFVEPESSREPLLQAINRATDSIDLEVYTMSDDDIIRGLIDARKRDVYVRVILEENPYKGYGANKDVKDKLSHYGVDTKWSNRVYQYTHSKFLVVDKITGYIMTLNLSKSAFTKNREFGLIVSDPLIVDELLKIFNADWNRKPYFPELSSLVVSPENSRTKIMDLLKSAKKEIDIYAEEIEDRKFIDTLKEKAQTVKVCVIVADPSSIDVNKAAIDELKKYMIEIKATTSPFIHAKVIIVDRELAYVGSVNFSSTSFDKNREVGVIISSKDAVTKLRNTFFQDFNKGR
jgi:phosphatidylserine/phosphatidylglycerophosphate/cardiolipin synthase-like enzyme